MSASSFHLAAATLPVAPVVSTLALVACGTAPLSFLDGRLQQQLPIERYAVRVVSVDGSLQFRNPVQVAPGPHWLVLEAAPSGSPRGTTQQSFALKIEPCTRYYLAASRTSPLVADWRLVIESTEPVAGCDPEEERNKAGAAAGPSARPASASGGS